MYRCTRFLQLSRGLQYVAKQSPKTLGSPPTCNLSTFSGQLLRRQKAPHSQSWGTQFRCYSSAEGEKTSVNLALVAGGIGAVLFMGSLIMSASSLTSDIIKTGTSEKPKVPVE